MRSLHLKMITGGVLLCVNLFVAVAMNVCAWASHVSPQDYPGISFFGMAFPVFMFATVAFLLLWLLLCPKFMTVSIVGLLLSAQSFRAYLPMNLPSAHPNGSILLMSYNVMGFGTGFTKDSIPGNDIVDYIRKSGADIVCMQECYGNKPQLVQEALADIYPYVSEFNTDAKCTELAMLSKYPILSSRLIAFESKSNAARCFEVAVGMDTLHIINCHLESYHLDEVDRENYKDLIRQPENEESEQRYDSLVSKLIVANVARAGQVDTLLSELRKLDGKYVVCCGDFNDPSISNTHWRLTRVLDDAYTRTGIGPGISYNRSGMYFRIDNILVSPNITPYEAKVDPFSKTSDHYPIISYLKFGTK